MKSDFAEFLLGLGQEQLLALVRALPADERQLLNHNWPGWSRTDQRTPDGDWSCWVICAGRGFGKTRAGAEWVREVAIKDPCARIALIGASLGEARSVMVEGESGLLAASAPGYAPEYEPSRRRLEWPSGAQAFLYSAGEPESLRGPQHSHARRAGAEGVLCQRGACPGRHAAASGRRGRDRRTPGRASRWRMLARRSKSDRGLDRPCGRNCGIPGGQLVVRQGG